MKTSSCKAKGRRCASELRDKILAYFPQLKGDDIVITSSGDTGEDLKLSPVARACFPFSVECKNVEKINIWQAIKQAHAHSDSSGHGPIVVFKRNGTPLYACIPIESLLYLLLPEEKECAPTMVS